jgi:hypothetical protein
MTVSDKPAWRGVVFMGEVWAWPMLLMDHNAAFNAFPSLERHTCRWRQWAQGGRIDFDPGCSEDDKAKVEAWVEAASR